MLACHSQWIERLLKADTFELLCWELREILDEFMDAIYIQGYNRTNRKAREILDYVAQEYRTGVTLDDIGRAVNLSSFRVSHLIKEVTGKMVTQHIRQLRVREAKNYSSTRINPMSRLPMHSVSPIRAILSNSFAWSRAQHQPGSGMVRIKALKKGRSV